MKQEPTDIRRKRSVVTDIRFSTGLDLRVAEAVALQDAGAIVVAADNDERPPEGR